ncbi:MAG TPA: xylulokinase [Chloroflexia bacterium]|nr:xylulokinase [Chloroflexia bacterium]
MPTTHFLGIDLGTSFLKLQVIDAAGAAVAAAGAPVPWRVPRPGWAEQDPAAWWAALGAACRDLFAPGGVDPHSIAAVGLSGQMHGAVFLDGAGAVLRPCLIWADARTAVQVGQIAERVPRDTLIGITGNAANTGFTAPKVLWVRQHEPEIYARTRHILLPKDSLRLRLTGGYATDVSDASTTLLFDLARRDWSPALLAACDIAPGLLPPVHESAAGMGAITGEAAAATGLRAGTPVVAGGGDAECSAFGLGLVGDADSAGAVLTSIGTSGQVFAVTARPVIDPQGRIHSLCHVVPDRWHVMGAILAGGLALRWLRAILTPPGDPPPEYDALTAEAAPIPAGADGLIFLPYLQGERTPHMDPQARGVFFGLRSDHTRAHLVRAVMEGVVFALRDGLEVFRALGIAPAEMRVAGGGARSPLWRQIQRDVFELPVCATAADHGAAYGAALLAAVGAGAFATAADAARAVPLGARTAPAPAQVAAYDAVYRRYRRLYPALRAEFAAD